MLYRLIVLTGPLKNQRITVDREPMTIGHAEDCRIVLPDDEVAQQHAILEDRGEGGLHIRDLGTMHKLIVNGREFRESRLKHGDMVEIGRTRFLVQAVVPADVSGRSSDPDDRMNPKLILAVAAVLALAALTWWRWPQTHPKGPPTAEPEPPVAVAAAQTDGSGSTAPVVPETAPEPPPAAPSVIPQPVFAITSPPPPVASIPAEGQSTQMTAEIERMRADLMALHASIKDLSKPPTAVTAVTAAVEAKAEPARVPPPAATGRPPASVTATNVVEVAAAQNLSPPTNLPTRPAPVAVTNQIAEASPAAAPVAGTFTGRLLRVLNVEQSRFPAGDEFDDMRTFNIILSQINTRHEISNTDIEIELTFYDEDQTSGEVHPSRAVPPVTGIRPTQPWGPSRRCTVGATYVLPKGSREKSKAGGRDERYYGFSVRVAYAGQLQDEWSLPRGLLKAAAATNAVTNVAVSAGTPETP